MNSSTLTPGPSSLLEVRNLEVYYDLSGRRVRAVDGVSLDVREGEVVGLIGESGCGKTTLGRAVVKLLPTYARIASGEILFENENLVQKDENEMRSIRGGKISMIFQNPTTSLNPSLTVGEQISEVVRLHQRVTRKSEVRTRVVDILRKVGIWDAQNRLGNYPYEFSVGMRQRVMIAMAVSANPKLVIADEPTSSLDVSVQARILELLHRLRKELQFSVVLITHNIGLAADMCDKIAIMYAGKVVEYGSKSAVLARPKHRYTFALLKAVPLLHTDVDKLYTVRGNPPDLTDPPVGCRFHPRCEYAEQTCKSHEPPLVTLEPDHIVSCFKPVT